MRVIRPSALSPTERRRSLLMSLSMLAVGVLAGQMTVVAGPQPAAAGVMGASAALGLGIGAAWLLRALRPSRTRDLTTALVRLLGDTFDDAYTLVVAPRLPIRDAARLDAVLVGPAGIRILTARDWHGRYRVRGRSWEFDARGRRGWIACRTNPSYDAVALSDGFARWATERELVDLPVRPAVVFPHRRSKIVLEEPADEIVTADNAPWWANTIGRVRRVDPPTAARVLSAVLDAAEQDPRAVASAPVRRAT